MNEGAFYKYLFGFPKLLVRWSNKRHYLPLGHLLELLIL